MEYLEKKKNGTNNDDDVLKDTILRIGCCLFLVVMVIAVGATILFVGNDMQEVNFKAHFISVISKVYPRFAEGSS